MAKPPVSPTLLAASSSLQQSDPSLAAFDPALFPDHHQPTHLATTGSDGPLDSSTMRERERNQLRVVAQGLAPELVWDQPLSVPSAPPTLRHCLASDAPLLPISVLRACLNEASTNALFSSATSLNASPEETTRLLNEVDTFQNTILGLLDEVERRYRAHEPRTNGIKREAEEDADSTAATKMQKYMLHRGGKNDGDLFTSAAFLSDRELEQIALLQETDLVAVHPASTASLSSYAAPVPSLGTVHPPFPPSTPSLPVSARYNLAPGQHPAVAPLLPALITPAAPSRPQSFTRETRMLDYGVWTSGFAPKFDSTGSTDGGYFRAATRAVGRERVKKWEKGLVANEPLPPVIRSSTVRHEEKEMGLTREEQDTLVGLNVEISDFLSQAKKAVEDEKRVWQVLERNLELIERLGRAQIARVRKSAKKEERRRRTGAKKPTNNSGAGEDVEDEDQGETKRDLAVGVEKQDADQLLESFTNLLSHFSTESVLPSLDSRSIPSLLPPPALIRSLAPLIIGDLTREASYTGGLEAVTPGGSAWEKAVKETGGIIKEE
ncbi:uncharacterized protein JCM15063_000171 [Sporobolomyces koalae]|uniref:uncharacterized protein n=1 Tax=Sporobolomyces koalae TaxID=500713 RepID=UPI00317CCFAA